MRLLSRLLSSLHRHRHALAIALMCTGLGALHAQAATNNDNAEPPSRVARLSYVAGDLGLLPADAQDWIDASVNRPLTTGDRLSSGHDGRAELEFGGAALRMNHRTDVDLLDLNEKMAQVELSQGTLSLSVRHLDPGQTYEIDTPTVALVIDRPGTFRVDIDDEGGNSSTRVTAFHGDATVYGENNAQRRVHAGRSYRFVDPALSAVAISDIRGSDNFDAWVNARDRRYVREDSGQYVPEDMVGTTDLAEYGTWVSSSVYGPIWYPDDTGPDWAPYRAGHWAYIAPWGWTWIDAMPWGYAPYHYGRWAHTGRGWGWIPGPRDVRSVYAPALVAFVGGGISVGIGGPVGWFPLGPGEIYNPWYHCDRGYYTRVNMNNIRRDRRHDERAFASRINTHYAHYRDHRPLHGNRHVNRKAPRGLTVMSGRDFATSRSVQRHLLRGDRAFLASAPVRNRGADLRPLPGKSTMVRSMHVRSLPLNGFRREVVARHAPPQRAAEFSGRMTGPARAALPLTHVRVLSRGYEHRNEPGRRRSDNRIAPTAIQPNRSHGSRTIPDHPVARRRIDGATGPVAQPRSREPTSARFVHPSGHRGPERVERQVRPGVSFIAPESRHPPAAIRPDSRLPQAPRIEPATMAERRAERTERRTVSSNMPRPGRYRPHDVAPHMRTESILRRSEFRAPRPMPARHEAPRPMKPAARPMPPRRASPARVEAPREHSRQAPASRREEPRRHDAGHQR